MKGIRLFKERGETLRTIVLHDRSRHPVADVVENAVAVESDSVDIVKRKDVHVSWPRTTTEAGPVYVNCV
jgi:hypothetical protein